MEKNTKRWVVGCGIGCGAVVVILVILLILGVYFVKNIVYKFEETGELADSLKELYGEIEDFVPSLDGHIPPERLEAFLRVRENLTPARENLEHTLSLLDRARKQEETNENQRRGQIFRLFKAGFGLIPGIGDYYTQRSQALLDIKMGFGEYTYIYILSYFCLLEKPPGDGPGFQLIQDDTEWSFDEWNREESIEMRNLRMVQRVNRLTLRILRNLTSIPESSFSNSEEKIWRQACEAEIRVLEADVNRIPWKGGLPEAVESALLPYLPRLERTYGPLTNILELAQI